MLVNVIFSDHFAAVYFLEEMMCAFTNDQTVIAIGKEYLLIIGGFFIHGALNIYNGALRGAGDTISRWLPVCSVCGHPHSAGLPTKCLVRAARDLVGNQDQYCPSGSAFITYILQDGYPGKKRCREMNRQNETGSNARSLCRCAAYERNLSFELHHLLMYLPTISNSKLTTVPFDLAEVRIIMCIRNNSHFKTILL